MSFPPFSSFKHKLIAIVFYLVLLLLLLGFCGCDSCLFSSTLLLLVCFPFIFSKIREPNVARSMDELTPESKHEPMPSTGEDEIAGENKSAQADCNELPTNEMPVISGECPSSGNDTLMSSETADSADDSLSDDESLIEIALEDESSTADFPPASFPEFSPELLFRKHGLMELLSEINEEDNMIEIDITMGTIKCSRFEIKA